MNISCANYIKTTKVIKTKMPRLSQGKHSKADGNAIQNQNVKPLYSEIMCPICLDVLKVTMAMLKVTMATKECLHRFCFSCITDALRKGNKECPLCREKLVSKRSLNPDPNYDFLISKIIKNDDEEPICSSDENGIVNESNDSSGTITTPTEQNSCNLLCLFNDEFNI